jgi:hypothetical protein
MSHSSRGRSDPARRQPQTSPGNFLGALQAELVMAWRWAVFPLKRLFESAIRDGIPPPTTFEGLPPGQFPPIEAIKDELFGSSRRGRHRTSLGGDVVQGVRIPPRPEDRARS